MRPRPKGQMPAIARNKVLLPDPEGPWIKSREPLANVQACVRNQRLASGQAQLQSIQLQ